MRIMIEFSDRTLATAVTALELQAKRMPSHSEEAIECLSLVTYLQNSENWSVKL